MDSLLRKIEVLKAMAHPVRIKILEDLAKGVKCVSDFEEFLGISQSNISQHLSILRANNVIDYFIDGRLRCYFLVNSMALDIIETLEKELKPLPAGMLC